MAGKALLPYLNPYALQMHSLGTQGFADPVS